MKKKHGEYTASQLEGNGALFSVSDALFGLVWRDDFLK